MKKIIVIFSGYNQRAIVSFLRTLDSNRLNYAIIANSDSDPILLTKYKSSVVSIRKTPELLLPIITRHIEVLQRKIKADEYIIAPSTEALNRFLLENKNQLRIMRCNVPLVEKKKYELISDKYKFGELCLKNNILVPKEYGYIENAKLPFVAKPIKYFSKKGKVYSPVIIKTKNDLKNFKENLEINDFYYQKFIGGRSIYLLYFFSKDGSIFKTSQENFMQQPGGKSILAAKISNFHWSNESIRYEKLFKSINFFGLVMVEFKNYKNKNYMIEANPRFWGPSQLFVDSNQNLFEAFLLDLSLIKKNSFNNSKKIEARYFWFGGLIQSLLNGGTISFHNYKLNIFFKSMFNWIAADVYMRGDTIKLFTNEINQKKICL